MVNNYRLTFRKRRFPTLSMNSSLSGKSKLGSVTRSSSMLTPRSSTPAISGCRTCGSTPATRPAGWAAPTTNKTRAPAESSARSVRPSIGSARPRILGYSIHGICRVELAAATHPLQGSRSGPVDDRGICRGARDEARARAGIAKSQFFPQIGYGGDWSRGLTSTYVQPGAGLARRGR